MTAEQLHRLASLLACSTDEARDALDQLGTHIQHELDRNGSVELPGLGHFARSDDRIAFTPDDRLAERVNAPYSGLGEVRPDAAPYEKREVFRITEPEAAAEEPAAEPPLPEEEELVVDTPPPATDADDWLPDEEFEEEELGEEEPAFTFFEPDETAGEATEEADEEQVAAESGPADSVEDVPYAPHDEEALPTEEEAALTEQNEIEEQEAAHEPAQDDRFDEVDDVEEEPSIGAPFPVAETTDEPAPAFNESVDAEDATSDESRSRAGAWIITILVLLFVGAGAWYGISLQQDGEAQPPEVASATGEGAPPSDAVPPAGEATSPAEGEAAAGADRSDVPADAQEAAPTVDDTESDPTGPASIVPEEGGWTIVVASELDPDRAEDRLQRFREAIDRDDLTAGVLEGRSGGVTRYRVGIGQLPTQDAAQQLMRDLEGQIPSDAWPMSIQ